MLVCMPISVSDLRSLEKKGLGVAGISKKGSISEDLSPPLEGERKMTSAC